MKQIKAFSLLECLFSLLLLSLCTIGILNFYNLSMRTYNKSLTRFRANYIRKVLEGYVATHGFLPYASKSLSKGLESDGYTVGYLPYKTLGINKSYLYDGFGRPFIFIVNENLVLKHNKKDGFIVFPPFMPSVYFYPKLKTWNRLNFYRSMNSQQKITSSNGQMFLWDYDDIDNDLNIILRKKSKNLCLSSIKIYPILDSKSLSMELTEEKLERWRDFYELNDLVAWALISNKRIKLDSLKKTPIVINLEDFFIVFWQSRFNLASQINHPTTVVNTYIGFCTHNLIVNYFKHMK